MYQLTAEDAGCWVDGHWGWRGSMRVVSIAHDFGWQAYTAAPLDEEDEFIYEIADEAEQWMNDEVAPEGYSFGWHDGEWFLWSHQDWKEAA